MKIWASSNRIFRRKEGLKGRHPKMWPNPTVGKPTVGKPTMSCEKGRRKIRIHKKAAKLLHVTSKENELVRRQQVCNRQKISQKRRCNRAHKQKLPRHIECEVEVTEKGHE